MTALGKLFRTTAFKLSLAYLVVFTVFAFSLLGYVAWNAGRVLTDQIASTIGAEVHGLDEQYRLGGLRRLVNIVERRSRQPGASLYLLTTSAGERIAGNVASIAPGTLDEAGLKEIAYGRNEDSEATPHSALARIYILPGGFRLLVGRDLEDRARLREVVWHAFGWSLLLVIVLGCGGGWFVMRRVLRRVEAMAETARTIMAGDLGGRLPVGGADDELDRLARNLNAMLDRIGELMAGMKEVSDNIAHDLKTPLTRLRNKADEALRLARTPDDLRAALQAIIEESDNLIRVFNALLMIARLEAGGAREAMADFDAADVARGVVELYEPAAEEAGVPIAVSAKEPLLLHGNRELLGQAVANLIDNAIKYSAEAGPIAVTAQRENGQAVITVADRGPGIPEAERGRVLERFVRLEAARSRPGFGLGLSLAAAVARLHGGALRLEDNAPGLRAVLSLPLRAEVDRPPAKDEAHRPRLAEPEAARHSAGAVQSDVALLYDAKCARPGPALTASEGQPV